MIKIKTFVFNPFQVNTYVLCDETKECVIIDPACYDDEERKEITEFIRTEGLKPVKLLATHCHIDHILGAKYLMESYKNMSFELDHAGMPFLKAAQGHASVFGLEIEEVPQPTHFIKERDIIRFGSSTLKVLSTPGHVNGSLCFYDEGQKFVIVGDVLFYGGVGRTDLPTGNYNQLMQSIQSKLMTLEDDTIVFSGHGDTTSIGEEKQNNSFING